MPTYRIKDPNGKEFDVTAPDGASEQEVLAYAQRSFKMAAAPKAEKPSKPFGQQLNDFISDAPRQLGLAARYGVEGLGGTFDALIGNPARTLAAPVLGNRPTADTGGTLADLVGLPKPKNADERIIGDAARTLAGGAVPIGAGAALARGATGNAAAIGRILAANPLQQLASAGAAGAAGGYTRETGGNQGAQLAASLAAGLAAPAALGAGQRIAQSARRVISPQAIPPAQIDITINNALQDSGLNLADLPANVAASVRKDVAQAFKLGENLSPDAVRRLADYRLTGLQPTQARLSLDPADVTRQANLSKLGANSSDPAAQLLARTQRENNQALTGGLNNLGAATTDDQIAGAGRIMDALGARNDRAKQLIDTAYQNARDTSGRSAALDPSAFTQKVGDKLNQANIESFLTPDIRRALNGVATGEIPLTVDVAEQLKTTIGNIQRNSQDGNVRTALGIVRSALDETPLLPGQQMGQQSIEAFNKARGLNRSWMQIVERTPALQAVRDGIEPDKFVQQFIVGNGSGASVMGVSQLKNSIKSSPDALAAVKEQITAYLKNKALGGAEDEIGNFSQSAFNKALNAIGERKLNLFFDKSEVNQLKALGRVAGYEQFQPAGSAVNNSNTAGAVGGLLERIGASPLLGKVPFGRAAIGEPLQNILISQQAGGALNVPRSLLDGAPRLPVGAMADPRLLLSPAAVLGYQQDEQRR